MIESCSPSDYLAETANATNTHIPNEISAHSNPNALSMTQSLTRVSAMADEDVGVEEKRLFGRKERRLSFIYG